jgi:uncharacterized protein
MQFIIKAFDLPDAMPRRMETRQAHLDYIAKLKAEGRALFGAALVNDAGEMCGSAVVYDFPTREEFDACIAADPYVVNRVWGDIEVTQCKVAPSFIAK